MVDSASVVEGAASPATAVMVVVVVVVSAVVVVSTSVLEGATDVVTVNPQAANTTAATSNAAALGPGRTWWVDPEAPRFHRSISKSLSTVERYETGDTDSNRNRVSRHGKRAAHDPPPRRWRL